MSNPIRWLGRIGRSVVATVLRQDCFLCGSPAEDLLCAGCQNSLPRLPAALCPVCALPTPAATACGACLSDPPHFDATLAAFYYRFPADKLVQALKYQARLPVARMLGHALADLTPVSADVLVPLPLHRDRLRERGFNQALEIARPIAERWAIPIDVSSVVREFNGAPQASLPVSDRHKNVRGAFLCRADLTGKSVLVVDDVMTTGATLNEFARELKKRAAVRVTNCVVARTVLDQGRGNRCSF